MEKTSVVVLWLLVVWAGVLVGGSLFERLVLTPMWASSPPESVRAWTNGAVQRSFFAVATPGWALFSLAAFAFSYAMPGAARPWARVAGVAGVSMMIWTVAFFIPILEKTEASRGAGLSGEEITRLTRQFVTWGALRGVVAFGGWLAAIRALVLASR